MQIADVGDGIDHALAVELEDQAEGGVRGGMLRAEVQCPQVVLLGGAVFESGLGNGHQGMTKVEWRMEEQLGLVSLKHREIVSLPAALQWIIFAEREGGEFVRHEDATEIGMAVEDDAE